ITHTAEPWRVRKSTTRGSALETTQMSEPMIISARLITIICRLPYMSPSRPLTGVNTADDSSVEVITQDASSAEDDSSRGSSGMMGTTRVNIIDTTMPLKASAAVTTPLDLPGGRGIATELRSIKLRFDSIS